ncbi:Pr6Pr family membrane protein [Streptomyces sp. NPDC020490]|uniref:Pr6Pr family membrane protein n=1 Tax=Streptomyces sp. NPDC020490 TaxID=3365078 RepID=UPI0037A92E66
MTAPIPKDIPDLPAIPGMPVPQSSLVPATAVVTPVRRPLVAAYRLLIALAAAAAVTVDLWLGSPARLLSHFTIQSEILLAAVFTLQARRAWTARHPLPSSWTGATLLYVTIAGSVYHLLLTDAASPFSMTGTTPLTGWQWTANQILHTAIPAAVLLDWLLLTPPGRLHLRQTATWMLYPLTYLAFSLARGELLPAGTPARYLYPFLDVDAHGYRNVLADALLLGLAFCALAALLVAVDHTRPDLIRHRGKTGFRL